MSSMRSLVAVGVVLLMASGVSFATTNYSYDQGTSGGGVTWANENTYNMNLFTTGSGNYINQLQVAWGNLAPGSSAKVVLYALPTFSVGGGTVLQTVDVTIGTNGTANGTSLIYDGVNTSNWLDPSNGNSAVTITNPVWSTYNIAPTAVTTPYFGVATFAYNPNAGAVATTLLDWNYTGAFTGGGGTNVAGPNISWIAITASNNPNLGNLDGAGYLTGWPDYGYSNNPYLIRAQGVPEPITMTSLFLALGGLGAWVRRRMARPQA